MPEIDRVTPNRAAPGGKHRHWRLIATAVAFILTAGACQSGSTARSDRGGTLTIGAYEPDCADPLLSCSFEAWGGAFPTMTLQTLPRPFDSPNGGYVPSVLLAGPPTLQAGPPQRVTYRINPKAVWSDGQPITSSDFRFTWSAIVHEKDVVNPSGYDQIANVYDSDPRTAVVTFTSPYPDWQDLFGNYGVLPKHLLEGRDRHAVMKDGYRWSGGPWLIQSWTKRHSIVLIPNPRFWGQRPKLDRVVFTFVTDNFTEEQAYRRGQVEVIAPIGRSSPADLTALPDTNFEITPGPNFEELDFNTEQPPLNDKAVRQALAYATNRGAVAQAVFDLAPQKTSIDSFLPPTNPFYVNAFSRYQRSLPKVDQIMGADGWNRGPDGIWVRHGQRATLEFTTFDINPIGRAEIEGNLLQRQWREAGFDVSTKPTPSPVLFGDAFPNGKFSTASFFQLWGNTISPADCFEWCSENIPPAGMTANFSRLRSPIVDDLYHKIATELDTTRRKALATQVQQVLADEVPALPLAATPTVIYWTTTVSGPIGAHNPLGPFSNLNLWYCKRGHCSTP